MLLRLISVEEKPEKGKHKAQYAVKAENLDSAVIIQSQKSGCEKPADKGAKLQCQKACEQEKELFPQGGPSRHQLANEAEDGRNTKAKHNAAEHEQRQWTFQIQDERGGGCDDGGEEQRTEHHLVGSVSPDEHISREMGEKNGHSRGREQQTLNQLLHPVPVEYGPSPLGWVKLFHAHKTVFVGNLLLLGRFHLISRWIAVVGRAGNGTACFNFPQKSFPPISAAGFI